MSLTSGDGSSGGDVSLREFVETRIDALDRQVELRVKAAERAVEIAMLAAKEAITKAETATEKRFDSVNEFREALNDMVARMMPRAESEQRHAAAREKIDLMMPRAEADQRWGTTSEKLSLMDARLTRIEGVGLGAKGLWGVLVAIIAAAAAVVGTVLALAR